MSLEQNESQGHLHEPIGNIMKIQKRLYQHEAKELGLKVKPNSPGRNQSNYWVTKTEWEEVKKKRSSFKERKFVETVRKLDKNGNVTSTVEKLQSDPIDVPDWFEIGQISTSPTTGQQWIRHIPKEGDRLKNLKAAIDELNKSIVPTESISAPVRINNDNLCNQYTLTDYHLGMMSWAEETGSNWSMKIAEEVLVRFFEEAISQSPKANEAIFAQIGDFLHWDGLDAVTPAHKNLLDADTRFTKLVRVAIRVIKRIIKMLLEKYQHVSVIMAEGNHDPASSIWLREMLSSFYEDEPRLTIDTNPDPYYCVTWGKCCLFYHHGHIRNMKNVESVFISKFKKEFGQSEYVYGHIGHLHHSKEETNLMTIEQHRTLAAKDAHASRGGYGSGRDSKVITYHKDFGEVGRNIININMIESKVKEAV